MRRWKSNAYQSYISTAVEVGVPKLGNCLEMYTCAQPSVQFVHSMCINMDTPCTLKLLLGHPLYTAELYTCLCTGLGTCVHFQAVSKLGHSNFHSSVGSQKITLQNYPVPSEAIHKKQPIRQNVSIRTSICTFR